MPACPEMAMAMEGKGGKRSEVFSGKAWRRRSFVCVSFATAVCADRVQNVPGGYMPPAEAESHPFSLIFWLPKLCR
jgi:hypothetical protein